MPGADGEFVPCGNLSSYKHCTRRAAHQLYGGYGGPRTRHQEAMRSALHALFRGGPCTTWDAAKIALRTRDMSLIRSKEKEYRRLFRGRSDTKRHTGGMLDAGLVVADEGGARSRYRLSIHGLLYCMDVMSPSDAEMDDAASSYAGVVPRVFGRWGRLREALGAGAHTPLKVLSKGVLLDWPGGGDDGDCPPLHEIMSYLGVKYHRWYESIPEGALAEQLSYWYYTFLLCRPPAGAQGAGGAALRLREAAWADGGLRAWYGGLLQEAASYYEGRAKTMSGLAPAPPPAASPGVPADRLPQGVRRDGLAEQGGK